MEKIKKLKVFTSPEEFYHTYIKSISGIIKLNRASDIKILASLCRVADVGTGEIILTKEIRTRLLKEVYPKKEMSFQNLTNSIRRIKNLGLLREEGEVLALSEDIFWIKSYTKKELELVINFIIE